MDELDFRKLVEEVAGRFRVEARVPVATDAVENLIRPMLPHLDEVSQSLQEGKIDREYLESCVKSILGEALEVAKELGDDYVGLGHTVVSMQRSCPYLFWC